MPVFRSMAIASWTNRPIAFSGTGLTAELSDAGTSKQYPCGFGKPPVLVPRALVLTVGPSVVSSQEIQLPQGVGPPAQLISVPERLTKSRTIVRFFGSITNVVVPPPAVLS